MNESPVPGPSGGRASRLSLSQKFAASSRLCSFKPKTTKHSPTIDADDKEIMQILSQDPFKLTNRTLAEEDDLISQVNDALTLSSKVSSDDKKPGVARSITSVVSISSTSEREMSPTPKKSTIVEFFTPIKCRRNSMSSGMGVSTLRSKNTARITSSSKTLPKTDIKKARKARRRICNNTSIKMLTNKYFDDSQKKIVDFFVKTDEDTDRVGYHRVLKESVMPAIVTGDEYIEGLMEVNLSEESSPIRPSQLKGPTMSPIPDDPEIIMDRVEKVQSACYDKEKEDWNMEVTAVPVGVVQDPEEDSGYSNDGPSTTECEPAGQHKSNDRKFPAPKRKSSARINTKPPESSANEKRKQRKIICPKYKIIAGTTFAVDGFRYGDIEGVTHYFLTHFHSDHYIGLKRSFSKPLIMSAITARLVKTFINVSEEFYIVLNLHEPCIIDDVKVTALDANHCPGAIMLLFQLPSGTNILHTGDFRASPDMEEYPEFWNLAIDIIYLDTTYLSTKYDFKSQWESITDACKVVRTFLNYNTGNKVLIVCGSYVIGKEKVWAELAAQFNFKVWTEPNRRKALNAIGDPFHHQYLVDDPSLAGIHVLSLNKLTYDQIVEYLDQFPDCYDAVIAIRPSGWEKNQTNRRYPYRGRINIIGIEYSEHSSYSELRRFVRFVRPQDVISTVPYGNSNQNRTPLVPAVWYSTEVRPERQAQQLSITSFVKVTAKNAVAAKEHKKLKATDNVPIQLSIVAKDSKQEETGTGKAVNSDTSEHDVDDDDSDWMP
ncbi:DNA cross-link repair 1A protein-like [Topomyia yanbarensis]|uniref:DNA cross-link repair 1A protein-like n=1 Tax=Topomyia yanbarensis TaxID=2498891 RepID=UPI00273C080D|nr:DNA cross-link repair 1A protein-like [Topomyia yanbarensis]